MQRNPVCGVVRRMTDLMLDELDRVDQALRATACCRFRRRGPRADRAYGAIVELAPRDRARPRRGCRGEPVPVRADDGLNGRRAVGGRSVEVASIGREGRSAGSSAAATRPLFPAPSCWSAVRLCGSRSACSKRRKALDVRREHFLPLLGLFALPGDAVRRLQCVSFDRATRRALAAARTGPRR